MEIVCLDLEGVLVPEIWIAFAEETGIQMCIRDRYNVSLKDSLMRPHVFLHGLNVPLEYTL